MTFNVYTLRDRSSRPLYVGVTCQLAERLRHHRRNQPWWSEVSFLTIEASAPNQALGQALELEAIQRIGPAYNVRGTDRFTDRGGWVARRANQARAHAAGYRCWRMWRCDAACRAAVTV